MSQFDSKTFNAEVFGKYLERVPRVKQSKLLEAGVLRPRRALRALLGDHAGGNYVTAVSYTHLDVYKRQRLVALRGARRREEVATAVGISFSALCMYETGRRIARDDVKIALAEYYGDVYKRQVHD